MLPGFDKFQQIIKELKKSKYQIVFKQNIIQEFVGIKKNNLELPQKYRSKDGVTLRTFPDKTAQRLLTF